MMLIAVGPTFALVDDDDFPRLAVHRWYLEHGRSNLYATARARNCNCLRMHRLLLDPPRDLLVDHINRNGLDNRRSNLRLCTRQQNTANSPPRTGRFKGVCSSEGIFRATIVVNAKQINLGRYANEHEAALAYDRAAQEHFGEFAWLNFPDPIVTQDLAA